VGSRTVDVHIRRLREKIPMLATAIKTIKPIGYKLCDLTDRDEA
jgi:DNA-binding response OmpR family regulator